MALLDFNEQWAQDTKEMIDAEGGISEVITVDVTKEESVKQAVARTVELFGRVDILVNIGECTLGLKCIHEAEPLQLVLAEPWATPLR